MSGDNHPSTDNMEDGTGTGMRLAAVYGTVTTHHGGIKETTKPDAGTTITVYLPQVEQTGPVPSDSSDGRDGTDGVIRRVLLVDDEEILLRVGSLLLKNLGYQVITSGNGDDAVEIYRKESGTIDLVILDMVMPKMGGRSAFLAMKKINPEVAVLLATGYSFDGETQAILDEGVKGFIQKPYSKDELADAIAAILGRC